ncbi:MAG: hypothetical protein LBT31_04645 [Synergistaceae bacterium]|nr:hypothetical protein [Synergistaceae bacterium]
MIASLLVWLLQDFMQVLAMGIMLVPEFFLLVVLYKLISGPLVSVRIAGWIWFAFLGGVLWDLRWAASPGMGGLINVLALVLVYWVWDRTPAGGRSALLFAALASCAHFLSGIARYVAWAVPSQAALRLFAIQQLLAVPVLVGLCMIYAFKVPQTHV